jgi:hypothetical protein
MSKRFVTGELFYEDRSALGQGWKFYHYQQRGQGVICGPFGKREDAAAARDILNQQAGEAEADAPRPPERPADETVSLPAGIFAVVDGQTLAFVPGNPAVPGFAVLDYAKAQRQMLAQCLERLDRWIELAKEITTRW